MQINWRDLGERAFWTGVAAFLTALGPLIVTTTDVPGLKLAVITAGTAAVTAVITFVRTVVPGLPTPGQAVKDETLAEVASLAPVTPAANVVPVTTGAPGTMKLSSEIKP
jgi:hypothetical protein